jgi:MoaA/NifB/PqqE/SkfB family radical SAM enzyme
MAAASTVAGRSPAGHASSPRIITDCATSEPAWIGTSEEPMSRLEQLKSSYDTGIAPAARAPLPQKMHIEITNSCNLKCVMCYSPNMKRRKHFMKISEFRNILGEAIRHGIRELGLYTTGEAFLHPKAVEFVRIAKREMQIPYVYITSNGTLLTPKKADGIIEAGLDSLNLSIDGASKETYEKIRLGGNFDKLLANLRYLRARRDAAGSTMRICITCVVMRTNERELGDFHAIFGALADEIIFQPVSNMAGQMVDQWESLLPPSIRETYRRAAKTNIDNPCSLLWKQINVSAEGFLTACCIDYELMMKYADLKTTSLAEAWNNVVMRGMRSSMIEQNYAELPMCGRCDQYRFDWVQLVSDVQQQIQKAVS